MKTHKIELKWLNFWDIIPANLMKIKFLWKIMLPAWKKDKKIFTSLLVNLNKLFNNLHLLKDLEKKVTKFFIWLTQLMSMSSNNWKNSMEKNSKTVLKKEWTLKKLKTKKRDSKNKKLNLKAFAKQLKKSSETKSKKLSWVTESKIAHAFWSLLNTDGVPTWNVSWKLKLWEMLQCNLICHLKKLWNWTHPTQLSLN